MSFGQGINRLSAYRGHMRIILDVVLVAVLLVLNANFGLLWGSTTRRGFFCDDESLMYPYRENTVSPAMLHWLSICIPLVMLLILESCHCWRTRGSYWQRFWPLYNTVRWFFFGYIASSLLKNMGKQSIGRLRPHFFAVCQPKLDDGGTCADEVHRQDFVYHTIYTCQEELSGATTKMLQDLHVSFPSGHSSKAFYGLVFMALYLQRTPWPEPTSLLRPLWQLLCVGLASFIGLSRVMDYKHHWSDVVAGSLLGTFVAFAVVRAAERELQLHLNKTEQHADIKGTQTAVRTAIKVEPDDEVAAPAVQLSHELSLVTCHSSN